MNSTPRVPANKNKKFPAEPLTQDEVRNLIRACSTRSSTGIRNRSLLVLMYRCGIRAAEALSVLPKDLDFANGSVRVLRGKGGKARLLGLDTGVIAALQVWLNRRAALGIGGRSPVFCTLKGKRLQSSYLRTLMPRLARKAGIERRCNPHSLRHSFAFETANENVPVHVLQQLLGHKNLSSTAIYLAHLNPQHAVAVMKAREWSW